MNWLVSACCWVAAWFSAVSATDVSPGGGLASAWYR